MTRARTDQNQTGIVSALRAAGCSVLILSSIGKGCPDILAATRRRSVLFEVKNPKQIPSKRKLTPAEAEWIAAWRGEVHVIETAEEALAHMGMLAVTPEEDEAFERMGGR